MLNELLESSLEHRLPLTPALSHGERGNGSQSLGKIRRCRYSYNRDTILPLWWGEGRGEGKGDAAGFESTVQRRRAVAFVELTF